MADFVFPAVVGATGDVHASALNPVGTQAVDENGATWVYLKGIGSTVAGSWVTFDEAGVTALLAANAKGPVAVAGAATIANTYGWYCRNAMSVSASIAANCADNAQIGRETADGVAGDGRAAGDEILGAITRAATTSAANIAVQIFYPFVNDLTGA